ncbi:collagenase-like [Teleopsis dalmanni]|uniref:collagenase-like n=1 Tax=Teleopsis dalmanni TaxID=139649 RepID=UPI0018CF0F5F|nr:collagenase-like [Teleopsis dalmanni]
MAAANPISTSCQSIASVSNSLNPSSSLGSGSVRSSGNHYVNGTGSLGRLKYYKHKSLDGSDDEELDYSQNEVNIFPNIFLLLVNIIVASESGDNVIRTQLIQGRIVAGQDATANQFPYQVFMKVQYDKHNGATCGGVLIGKNWVLTIAKCTQNVTNATLYLGSNERNSFPVVISVQENEIFPHPDYNPKYHNNDIGLIRIPPLTLNDTVNIIRLPYMGTTNTYADQYAYAVGWGNTNSGI